MSYITIAEKACTKDGLCLRVCPANILIYGPDGFPTTDPQKEPYCIRCGQCQAICPNDALTLRNVAPQDQPAIMKEQLEWAKIAGLIQSRRSVRKYKKTPVPPEVLTKLLDITRWAPTGGNSQLVRWILIEKPESIKKVISLTAEWASGIEMFKFLTDAWAAGHDAILRGAPHLAIAHAGNEYGSTAADCAIAVTTLDLAASSQGLGTCWAGFFMIACASGYKPLLDFLQLPENHKVHAALMLGYPKYSYHRVPVRQPLQLKRI
jgi:nitroreductase/NAD-dependent dihydropyrimidine dehydrogenase PreA subunit